jgi:hypothetical protein
MIETFIRENIRLPWLPGHVDCLLVLADWCMWNGWPDPAADLRGTYHDEAGYQAIIAKAGGAVPFVGGRADRIGLRRSETAVVGSIAIIGSKTDIQRQWGAIWDGSSWRVRFVNDYPPVKARSLAIWSF